MAIEIPHGAFPPRFENGQMVVVEQDSVQHLADRVAVTAFTTIGDRVEDPAFGIPDEVFRVNGVDIDALTAAINESEPNATVTVTLDNDPRTEHRYLEIAGLTLSTVLELSGGLLLSSTTGGSKQVTVPAPAGTDRILILIDED
jgi:hypothetical protein